MPAKSYDLVQAFLKSASIADSASSGGKTSHPSGSADGNTQPVKTGPQFAENTEAAKKLVGKPGVESTADASATDSSAAQDKVQPNIGTHQSETGGDPSIEDDYGGTTKDHPTTSVMTADDGKKYAEYRTWPIQKLANHVNARRQEVLASIANGEFSPAKVATKVASAPVAVSADVAAAAAAGYKEASDLTSQSTKIASDMIESVITEADISAELAAMAIEKFANDAMQEGDVHGGGMPPEMAGGPPPGGPGGGMPPEMAGGPPGGPGGPPPGGPGEMGPEDHAQQLVAALTEAGMTSEDLMHLAVKMQQAEGAGGAPGGPPGGGGLPEGGDEAKMAAAVEAIDLFKIASACHTHVVTHRFKVEGAKTAAQAELRQVAKNYFIELMQRYPS